MSKEPIFIRFEQAEFAYNNADKVQVYHDKFYGILREFTKSPFLQMMCGDYFYKLIDLSEHVYEKDFSKLLFEQLDNVFDEFEELQSRPELSKLKYRLQEFIVKYNEQIKDQ